MILVIWNSDHDHFHDRESGCDLYIANGDHMLHDIYRKRVHSFVRVRLRVRVRLTDSRTAHSISTAQGTTLPAYPAAQKTRAAGLSRICTHVQAGGHRRGGYTTRVAAAGACSERAPGYRLPAAPPRALGAPLHHWSAVRLDLHPVRDRRQLQQ